VAVIQLAGLLHHEQMPCLSFSVQTRLQWLQCPCGLSWSGLAITLELILTPFQRGQAFTFGTGRFRIQFLRCFVSLCFQLHYLTKIHKVKSQEIARLSSLPPVGKFSSNGKPQSVSSFRALMTSSFAGPSLTGVNLRGSICIDAMLCI